MATTANGTPYVEASDLVAAYPAVSLALAEHIDDNTGKVLQVVAFSSALNPASTSATYADTGLTATITPTLATSEILVMVLHTGCGKYVGNTYMGVRLFRGATQIAQVTVQGGANQSVANNYFDSTGINYLDSPATTSATTYKTQFNSGANISIVRVNNGGTSSITLMEIGA
jgi:hypothetical protein